MADTNSTSQEHDEVGPNIMIQELLGLVSKRDSRDLRPGEAAHQVNCGMGPRGELRVRMGAKPVQFDPA
jgi:hypothetical protein